MSRSLRRLCIPLFLHAALAGLWAPAASAQPAEPQASHPFAASRPIAGRYIVTFVAGVANPAAEAASQMRGVGAGGQLHHVYTNAIKGFAATLPASAVAALRNNPNVQAIEQDQTVSLVAELATQNEATWGLDRIDQADRPLDSQYHYWTGAGSGVTAFIIDTGIRADHVDFSGRVLPGYTSIGDNRGTDDCNGHGTHVSGTVGGTTWGVAKQVSLVPVRVLDCRGSGTWSGVIAGIDWVAGNSALRPAVANMSLGGGKSSAVNAAVAGAVVKGVTMVVAAGNSSANACNYSPASEPSALTVGATTTATTGSDVRASYSNYGTCVDLFAPGSSITSAWHTSSNATNTISGTSMASPHVAGAAALAVQANPGATPTAIGWFLVSSATPDRIGSVGSGSPNLLLYSVATGTATEPPWPVIAIRAMTGSASLSKNGRSWQAKATATVGEVFGTQAPMANVSVNGTFDPGGKASCVTAATTGSCTLTSAAITISSSMPTMTTFTVDSLSGYHMLYQHSYNQPAQITITMP